MNREHEKRGAFQTLRRAVEARGIGLHSGVGLRARLVPRHEPGFAFARVDLPGAPCIEAVPDRVTCTTHATTLEQDGVTVATTEHLLAALWTMGITHCRVELDGPEVPILDGSAAGWCRLLREAGASAVATPATNGAVASTSPASPATGADSVYAPRPLYTLREPVWIGEGECSLLGLPHEALRVTVAVEYARDYVGAQTFDALVTPSVFETEIAPARTFTLEEWIEPLRAQGLIRGGGTHNALVLGREASSAAWRFPNEMARHKALDVLGDIALLFGADGGALRAHLIALRSGHGLHRRWMQECLRRQALEAST